MSNYIPSRQGWKKDKISQDLTSSDIWEHLRQCTDSNWLIDRDSQKLFELTQEYLKQLRKLTLQSTTQSNILIAEIEPVRFMAAFLASIIAKVNIFLGNPNWRYREWQQALNLVNYQFIFASESVEKLMLNIGNSNHFIEQELANPTDNSLIMIPTGGTSGKIKFAIHTWSTLTASVLGIKKYFQQSAINSYCILPLFHVSGLLQFIRSLITQGKLAILSYQDLKQGKKPSVDYSNFFLSLVPTQLEYLLKLNPLWLAQFQVVLLGGAPARRSLLDRARAYNIPLALTYGMTETASGIVTLKPQDFLQGNNSSGRALPHAQVKIMGDRPVGRIEIEANSLFLGYYPYPSTKPSYRTDDLGWLDEAGYLHLVGRNSQKIITGGENVFPAEVEAAILDTNLVKDTCIIGLKDTQWGQVVTALYVPLKLDITPDAIEQKLQDQLSKYKHPKYWIQVDHLPRNDRGKINYLKARSIAQNWLDKQQKI